jgi:hypothetical protein
VITLCPECNITHSVEDCKLDAILNGYSQWRLEGFWHSSVNPHLEHLLNFRKGVDSLEEEMGCDEDSLYGHYFESLGYKFGELKDV